MAYRNLHQQEILTLEHRGCRTDDWTKIQVTENFSPEHICDVQFSGAIKLGVFDKKIETVDGVLRSSGLYRCFIANCEIGDNVYISNVGQLVNYRIDHDVVIEEVGSISVRGTTGFGNGVIIDVLNEGGGRQLPIFDRLTAQSAWLMVQCRHDPVLTKRLLSLVDQYIKSRVSDQGVIGPFARISHCSVIRNILIGEYATLTGATLLEEGTIAGSKEDPVKVGENVIAKKFIILSGAKIDGGAMLDKCFVGQSVQMGKQYSAENSVFFANSECFHGEAVSVFAGPYTVSHHKSSLLIAGEFSFYNAGSGTNQSNHMYKLGPLHQGVLERGSKTGSFSYMMWPTKVGPFSVVMGKHTGSFDAGDLPFSYITEEHGKSVITPGMNLFTVGTQRDSQKWPARDRRKAHEKYDLIHFDLYSPFIMQKVLKGIETLDALSQKALKTQEYIYFKGASILRLMLKTCRKYYEMAMKVYVGNELIKILGNEDHLDSLDKIKQKILDGGSKGTGVWIDAAGLLMPVNAVQELFENIKNNQITSVELLNDSFIQIHQEYQNYTKAWFSELLQQQYGKDLSAFNGQHLIQVINDWKTSSVKLINMILKDAEKEFDVTSQISYGYYDEETVRQMDFQQVRGTLEENKFILDLKEKAEAIEQQAGEIIENFGGIGI